MILVTPADITGDGTAHKLSEIPGIGLTRTRWFQFTGITIGTAASARVGDASIDSSRGILIPANGGQFCPPLITNDDPASWYDLTQIYYLLANSDTAQFAAVAGV